MTKDEQSPLPIHDLALQDQRMLHILQALALPASDQQSLYPDNVVIADELAFEFTYALMPFLGGKGFILEGQHVEPLFALDDAIDHLSDHVPDAWTRQAHELHASWQEIRNLALKALTALGWPLEKPPSYHNESFE